VALCFLWYIDISTSKSARFLVVDWLHLGDFAWCPPCCPCYDYTKDYGLSNPYHHVACHLSTRPDCDYHYDQCKDYCVRHLSTEHSSLKPNPSASVTSDPMTSTPMTHDHLTSATLTSAPATFLSTSARPVKCDKIKVLDAIALNIAISINDNVNQSCPDHPDKAPSDDLMYTVCDVTPQSTVFKGAAMMRNCYFHKPYTAVKAFTTDTKNLSLALSGVFIECLPNGFKMVVQSCESAPYILSVTEDNHQGALAPQFYHMLMT
ncbi:uncharacterized protein LOC132555492, partial [Ylistrum balloti]|uniref:uncharacterized protein LOC132555492 n=1 Tax=Ylistrum balloti TaxID=509963 RepID=UPI002905CA17